jgi:gliding motility-associated-like protein
MRHIFLILFSFFSITSFAGSNEIDKTKQAKEWLRKKPLAFIENKGQFTDSEGKPSDNVLFKASYGNCDIYITTEGLSYVFVKYEEKQQKSRDTNDFQRLPGEKTVNNKTVSFYRMDMNLQGSNINKTQIIKELPGKQGVTNYFYPHCPEGIYGVQEYGKITIKNIYKGIDWVIYTNADNKESPLKYDFVVQPQADYKDIKIKFVNAQSTSLADNGTKLKIQTIAGNIEEGNLYSYLENSTEKQAIKTKYIANADSTLQFELGTYDKTKTLVIDPMVWATYYGGSNENGFISICTDSQDNIYITGITLPTNLPTQLLPGAFFQSVGGGGYDTFILKFTTKGIRLWATYYGGFDSDNCASILADSQDNIYITGETGSSDFPTQELTGAYFQANMAGIDDAFIIKFNKNGTRQWATYYGGSGYDVAKSLTTDSQDNIYITGNTFSHDFPTQSLPGAYNQIKYLYSEDIFIVKFNSQGVVNWATCYGGESFDEVSTIRADSQDNIFITGETYSTDFPTQQLAGAYNQSGLGGSTGTLNAFIVKFDKVGQRKWATYYGGSVYDIGLSICFNSKDDIYITGLTISKDFPVQLFTGAYNQTHNAGNFDAFILKFNNKGVRIWSTYYGGSSNDQGYSICSDSQNNIFVTGYTESTDLPTQQLNSEYWQPTNAGKEDYFIVKFNDQDSRKWATYYGGENSDWGKGLAVDSQNSIYCIGYLSLGAYTIDYGNGAYFDNDPINGSLGGILKITPCNKNIKPSSVQSDRNNICIKDNGFITLTAIGGIGDTLKWYSDNLGLNFVGKDTPLIIPSPAQTTTYYARWESLCDTSACDSIVIQIYSNKNATQSQQICHGDTYSIGNSAYTMAGVYTDTIPHVSGCDSIVTTNLTIIPVAQTAQTLSICEGESLVFGSHSYTVTGAYRDTLASRILGCDSIITTNLIVNPKEQFAAFSSICDGESITVGKNSYSKTGVYTDILKTYLNCDSTVITDLTVNSLPLVSLGNDMLLCPGDSIILSPGDGFISYLWSDGSVLNYLKVNKTGTYSVIAFNEWCPASAEVTIRECGAELWFPTAFSPNNDYNNDTFKPVALGTLNAFHLIIYNRWGQQVYESHQVNPGWDGTFQGSICTAGQYVYIATYSMGAEPSTQKQQIQRGAFTLLR